MTKFKPLQKIIATFLFAFSCSLASVAQISPGIDIKPSSTTIVQACDSLNCADNTGAKPDNSVVLQNQYSFDDVDFPMYNDSILEMRLNKIQTCIPLEFNEQVKAYINLYIEKRRESVSKMVGLSTIYFPIFDQVFNSYGLPCELKYLSIIESALNPNAVSRAGAVGTWQFMYYTAKMYGLQMNTYVDERKDLWKATDAAARYLKDGYERYGDWLLSIASYNCGAGNVDLAIKKSGGKCSFWDIAPYLPKETRGYVPAFIAAAYVMNFYQLHDITATDPTYAFASIGSVAVDSKMSFEQVAKFTLMSVDEVKFLNPGFKTNIIPAASSSYTLALPVDKLPMYDAKKDSIVMMSQTSALSYYTATNTPYTSGYISYYVKSGESLGVIAAKYGVTVTQLKAWNNLSSNLIYPNQKLVIYSKVIAPTTTTTSSGTTKIISYTIKYGDTLWGLTQKYPGLSIDQIKANNPASKYNNLQPGMVLSLPVKS